jgi:hypothetical protein
MKSPRSLIYTGVGLLFFVILPFFLIASDHMKKQLPGNDCTVTNISGAAGVQYQAAYHLEKKSKDAAAYTRTSQWIPLKQGSQIAYGALVKTGQKSFVDIMIKDIGAFRVNEKSLLKLERINEKPKIICLTLNDGKVLCRTINSKSAKDDNKSCGYGVRTPTATISVQGTTFSVDYLPVKKMTRVAVADGVVHIKSTGNSAFNSKVQKGEKMRIAPSIPHPRLENITPGISRELLATQNLKIKKTGTDRLNEMMDLVIASPFYNKALGIITRYEMKSFKRAVIYYARLVWGDTVPGSLQDVELEEGDYQDPWNTDYFYEKIEAKKAVLISAGPDKILHTEDDIFMSINL